MSSSTETRMFAYFVPEKNLVVDERERERKKGKKGEEKKRDVFSTLNIYIQRGVFSRDMSESIETS